jgi:hypothetical protein
MVVSGQLQALASLTSGKVPHVPLDRKLSEPQSQSGRCREDKNTALPGIEPGPSSASLYRLGYPNFYRYKYIMNCIPVIVLDNIMARKIINYCIIRRCSGYNGPI